MAAATATTPSSTSSTIPLAGSSTKKQQQQYERVKQQYLFPSAFSSDPSDLRLNNLLHLYVGTLHNQHMILPLHLHLHPHFFIPTSTSASTRTPTSTAAPLYTSNQAFSQDALSTLVNELPRLIESMQSSTLKTKINKFKPRIIRTKSVIMSYQFKQTDPYYHLFTYKYHSKSHSDNDKERETKHRKASNKRKRKADEEEELDDGNGSDNDDDVYKGNDYNGYSVSAHSLHVRCILTREAAAAQRSLHTESMNSVAPSPSPSPSPSPKPTTTTAKPVAATLLPTATSSINASSATTSSGQSATSLSTSTSTSNKGRSESGVDVVMHKAVDEEYANRFPSIGDG